MPERLAIFIAKRVRPVDAGKFEGATIDAGEEIPS
jgi:hypothetical protein